MTYAWNIYDPPFPVTGERDEYNWDIVGGWEIPLSAWMRSQRSIIMRNLDIMLSLR